MRTKGGNAGLVVIFSADVDRENIAHRSSMFEICSTRGVRKVTTGITGLWQPSVHSDVAF